MPSHDLATQQTILLRAIAAPSFTNAIDLIAGCAHSNWAAGIFNTHLLAKRGLQAYRANAHALAARALQTTYPVMEQMLGSETFAMLARDLWHDHPPQRGDLAQWADALAAWLSLAPALSDLVAEHPYLCDVARAEWALHRCATASDASLDAASFTLLTTHEPAHVRLRLAHGAQVQYSAYPVASMLLAHGSGGADASTTAQHMHSLSALLQQGCAETALVWRQAYAPKVRALATQEEAFVAAVVSGAHLLAAMDAAHPDFDFSTWLPSQVQNGLVVGADALVASNH